jgi:hypothetical protein
MGILWDPQANLSARDRLDLQIHGVTHREILPQPMGIPMDNMRFLGNAFDPEEPRALLIAPGRDRRHPVPFLDTH